MDKKISNYINYCCGELLKKQRGILEYQNQLQIQTKRIEDIELEVGFLLRDSLTLCQSIIDYSFVAVIKDRDFNLSLPISNCLDFIEQEIDNRSNKNILESSVIENLEQIYWKSFEDFEKKWKDKIEKNKKVFGLIFQRFLWKFTGIHDSLYPPEKRRNQIPYFNIKTSQLILFKLINYYKHVGFAEIKYQHGDIEIEWSIKENGEIFKIDGKSVRQFIYNCVTFWNEVCTIEE